MLAHFSPIGSLILFGLLAIFYVFDQQAAAETTRGGAGVGKS